MDQQNESAQIFTPEEKQESNGFSEGYSDGFYSKTNQTIGRDFNTNVPWVKGYIRGYNAALDDYGIKKPQ